MINKMQIMLLGGLLLAVVLLTGCDKRQDVVLDEAEIEGPITIKLVQEVKRKIADDYTLEVYDSQGRLRAILRSSGELREGAMLVHDDGRTWMVKNGKRGFIQSDETPLKKESLE